MFNQIVTFHSKLTTEEVLAVAHDRAPLFRKVSGLIQKYYLVNEDGSYSGFYLWESKAHMLAFRETELAKTIPLAYKIDGAPEVRLGNCPFALHEGDIAA